MHTDIAPLDITPGAIYIRQFSATTARHFCLVGPWRKPLTNCHPLCLELNSESGSKFTKTGHASGYFPTKTFALILLAKRLSPLKRTNDQGKLLCRALIRNKKSKVELSLRLLAVAVIFKDPKQNPLQSGASGLATPEEASLDAMAEAGADTADAPRSQFEIMEWVPAYTSCQKYFLDHAQYDAGVQAAAAFTNIRLPHQWPSPVFTSVNNALPSRAQAGTLQDRSPGPTSSDRQPGPSSSGSSASGSNASPPSVSLYPYIRRLIVTGFDRPAVLQGFFGDEWRKGVGPLHESERRNYMFLAKAGGWAKVKAHYDISPQETVPFLQPLQNVTLREIQSGEREWSRWLAMEDWMVGPRAPSASSITLDSGGGDEEMDDTTEGQRQ